MLKRKMFLIGLVIVFLSIGWLVGSVHAQAQISSPNSTPASTDYSTYAKAILMHVPSGYTVSLPILSKEIVNEQGKREKIWEITIPSVLLSEEAIILGSNSKEVSKTDPTLSVRLTLHQSYWETWRNSARYVAIDFYKGKFEKLDSTVSWSNARLEASCYGQYWEGGFCNLYETVYIGTPNAGQWYYQYPSWRGRYVEVNMIANQSGAIYIRLTRGGSTWDFRFCVSQGGTGCD